MPLKIDELSHDEWAATSPREIRLRLRKDGSGYYDRKEPGGKLIHEKLSFKVEGDVLRIKLNHARLWVDVAAEVHKGPSAEGERFGERELVLEKDPYATAIEELPAAQLILQSDAGASLPSS